MNILLDTHAFLWLIQGDDRLSERAETVFLDAENELFLSAVSYWEICIKQSLGKLGLAGNWQRTLDNELVANSVKWLFIEKAHCQGVVTLPMYHRDPFDRLLIAQTQHEDMILLTADSNIKKYEVTTYW